MTAILAIIYGVYFVLVGVRGNALGLVNDLSQEGQFIYWVIVLLVVAALWETETGAQVARPLAALIIVGFLLVNWTKLVTNLRAVAPATSGGGGGK